MIGKKRKEDVFLDAGCSSSCNAYFEYKVKDGCVYTGCRQSLACCFILHYEFAGRRSFARDCPILKGLDTTMANAWQIQSALVQTSKALPKLHPYIYSVYTACTYDTASPATLFTAHAWYSIDITICVVVLTYAGQVGWATFINASLTTSDMRNLGPADSNKHAALSAACTTTELNTTSVRSEEQCSKHDIKSYHS